MTTSPTCRPAFSAGVPGSIVVSTAPDRSGSLKAFASQVSPADLGSHIAADNFAGLDQLIHDFPRHAERNREADALIAAAPPARMAVLIPIRSPCVFTSAPPELPGLMAASV